MKNLRTGIVMIAAIILSAFMTACGGNKNDNRDNGMMENMSEKDGMGDTMKEDDAMQSDMSPMMTSYMEIKDALVADDPKAAREAAGNMMDMPEMSDAMKSSLKGIAGSEDLKEQRKSFSELSMQMYQMAKDGEMDKTMYWNHCPMAMDGEGANWLSMSEKISNPYMGQKMPECGSVQETVNE